MRGGTAAPVTGRRQSAVWSACALKESVKGKWLYDKAARVLPVS
jgi:hypothetical protein